MEWQAVYDLRDDRDYVAAVQMATLTTSEFGIEPTHGLFGSAEWWRRIESGSLPVQTLKGRISRVFMGSMGDWPEFEVTSDDGSTHVFTRLQTPPDGGRDGLYEEGRGVEVDFVLQEARRQAPDCGIPRTSPAVIAIRIATG